MRLLAKKRTYALLETIDPATAVLAVRSDGPNAPLTRCIHLNWTDFENLMKHPGNPDRIGFITTFAIAPDNKTIHLFPAPVATIEAVFRYTPAPRQI